MINLGLLFAWKHMAEVCCSPFEGFFYDLNMKKEMELQREYKNINHIRGAVDFGEPRIFDGCDFWLGSINKLLR